MAKKSTKELIIELNGTVCRCGKTKKAKQSFCHTCYYTLPEAVRKLLYRRIGEGYGLAYDKACKILDAIKAKPKPLDA